MIVDLNHYNKQVELERLSLILGIIENDANIVFDFVVNNMNNISKAKDKILLTNDLKAMIANEKYISFGKLCEILEKNDQTKEYYADILIKNPVDKIISDKSKQIYG